MLGHTTDYVASFEIEICISQSFSIQSGDRSVFKGFADVFPNWTKT